MGETQNVAQQGVEKSLAERLAEVEAALASAPDDAALLIEKGKLLWRMGRKGDAISAYEKAAAIEPDGPARLLIEHSNSIMDFFNPDLLNP